MHYLWPLCTGWKTTIETASVAQVYSFLAIGRRQDVEVRVALGHTPAECIGHTLTTPFVELIATHLTLPDTVS